MTPNIQPDKKEITLFLLITSAALLVMILLNSCKDKPVVEPLQSDVIETFYKPVIDSLNREITSCKDSLYYWKKVAAKADVKKEVAKEKVTASKEKVVAAVKSGDTLAIIISQQNQISEQEQLISEQDAQITAQGKIIEKHEAILIHTGELLKITDTKLNALKQAFEDQSAALLQEKKQHVKDLKKLKRAKFFNKVLGVGTAAGIGLAAIMFL